MNWLDAVVGVALGLFVLRGVSRGLFREVAALGGVFAGLVVAINRYGLLGRSIYRELPVLSPTVAAVIAFMVIFIGIAIVGALIGLATQSLVRSIGGRIVDGVGGAVVGLVEGALVCGVVLLVITVSPILEQADGVVNGSFLGPRLMKAGPVVYDTVVRVTPGKARSFMERLKDVDTFEKWLNENIAVPS